MKRVRRPDRHEPARARCFEGSAECAGWQAEPSAGGTVVGHDGSARAPSVEAQHRCVGLLRCAKVALAAERFRMARGDWPTTLDDLVPHFLSEAQRDPFRQDTLLMRQSEEGLIVYSVGPDRIDDGGSVGIEPDQKLPLDIGFRLWDVDKRRQPASTN